MPNPTGNHDAPSGERAASPGPASRGSKATPVVIALIIGLCLVCAGVPVVGVVAAIAIPNFVAMQYRAKRAEVPANVKAIKTALIAHDASYDEFVAAGPHPVRVEALGKTANSWTRGSGFDTLNWAPDGHVRGTYMVEVDATGRDFVVHGWIDVDGDAVPAHYTATRSTNVSLVTPGDVY